MLVDFNEFQEITIAGMNGGTGMMSTKMFMDEQGKIIHTKIHSGGSIGMHKHETSDDINYVISGTGKAVCDGEEPPEICSVGYDAAAETLAMARGCGRASETGSDGSSRT